jgi:hypothetical protein
MMSGPVQRRERSFGLSVGTVAVLIALALAWRGSVGRAEIVGAIGLVLVTLGWLRPIWLKIPSDVWWACAGVLGWINARVLLSLAFFLVLTPLGVVRRLVGRDSLSRRRTSFRGWTPYPDRYRNDKHFERMY